MCTITFSSVLVYWFLTMKYMFITKRYPKTAHSFKGNLETLANLFFSSVRSKLWSRSTGTVISCFFIPFHANIIRILLSSSSLSTFSNICLHKPVYSSFCSIFHLSKIQRPSTLSMSVPYLPHFPISAFIFYSLSLSL